MVGDVVVALDTFPRMEVSVALATRMRSVVVVGHVVGANGHGFPLQGFRDLCVALPQWGDTGVFDSSLVHTSYIWGMA